MAAEAIEVIDLSLEDQPVAQGSHETDASNTAVTLLENFRLLHYSRCTHLAAVDFVAESCDPFRHSLNASELFLETLRLLVIFALRFLFSLDSLHFVLDRCAGLVGEDISQGRCLHHTSHFLVNLQCIRAPAVRFMRLSPHLIHSFLNRREELFLHLCVVTGTQVAERRLSDFHKFFVRICKHI